MVQESRELKKKYEELETQLKQEKDQHDDLNKSYSVIENHLEQEKNENEELKKKYAEKL